MKYGLLEASINALDMSLILLISVTYAVWVFSVRKGQHEPVRKSNLLADDSVFGDLMSEAGATLSAESRPVELCENLKLLLTF